MQRALKPDEISLLFIDRANAGNVEGLVELYEIDAALDVGNAKLARGHEEIRKFYAGLLALKPVFTPGRQQPALIAGGLAITSTQLSDGTVTVEIARQQNDGSWLWVADQPSLLQHWSNSTDEQRGRQSHQSPDRENDNA